MFALSLENESGNIVNINDDRRYVVTAVSGLNPPSASIFTAKSPNKKGVKYNGSTLNERHMIITMKILGDIEKNRNYLYDWVDTEQYIKIHYKNGIKNVYCEGHVEDCDIDLFTDNEIINLAVICENPYWKALQEISTEISSLLKQFTFPFAIDSEGIPFSTIRESNKTNVFNSGAETGVKIIIKCNGDIKNLAIYYGNDISNEFKINATLRKNWTVEIDTEASPKTVKAFKPDGTTENFLKYVGDNPTWFTLKKGNNTFWYNAESGGTNAEIFIGFNTQYLGV